ITNKAVPDPTSDNEDVLYVCPVPDRNDTLPVTVAGPMLLFQAFNSQPNPTEPPNKASAVQPSKIGKMRVSGSRQSFSRTGPSRRTSSAHALSPTTVKAPHQTPSAGPQMSSGGELIIPAGSSTPTVVTGNIPPHASSRAGVPYAIEQEMKTVFKQQVFPHIHAALRPHLHTLTLQQRIEIGGAAASKLVAARGFMTNYIKNSKSLTPAYETKVEQNAYFFVARSIKKYQYLASRHISTTHGRSNSTALWMFLSDQVQTRQKRNFELPSFIWYDAFSKPGTWPPLGLQLLEGLDEK
ncbi:hypothetical protein IFR05_017483, partial [Cadophora sp. M221]